MPKRSTKFSAKKIKNSPRDEAAGKFLITNPAGIHTRPAAAFVQLAKSFSANILVRKGKNLVDGKSILNILTLEATCGQQIEIIAKGIKAKEAVLELGALIEAGFYE